MSRSKASVIAPPRIRSTAVRPVRGSRPPLSLWRSGIPHLLFCERSLRTERMLGIPVERVLITHRSHPAAELLRPSGLRMPHSRCSDCLERSQKSGEIA